MSGKIFQFGEFKLDCDSFELSRAGRSLKLERKPLELLILLAQRNGQLVSRAEIAECLWGSEVFVDTEHGINTAIRKIRNILRDDSEQPQFIATVTGKGYRFIGRIAETAAVTEATDPPTILEPPTAVFPPLVSVSPDLRPGPDQTHTPFVSQPAARNKTFPFAVTALAAVPIAGVAIWLTPQPVGGLLESTQITFSAEQKDANLFTDGSRLYFESRREPTQMALNGGMLAHMSALNANMSLLDISADASQLIAWTQEKEDEVGRGELWIIPSLGGTPRRLGNHLAQRARWSPEGKSIVFADGHALYICGEDGANTRKLWDAPGYITDIYFAPDGRQLSASVAMAPASRLWRIGVDGTNPHLLSFDWPAQADQAAGKWTPDGRHFIFTSALEGRHNVYELAEPRWFEFWKKPKAVRITGNQIDILDTAPARDSKSLFVLGRLDQGAMYAYDSRGKSMVPYLNGISALAFVISPDRQWMAYTEYPSGNLWKSKLDGSERLQLTTTPAYMQQWSPDGKSIVYSDWHKLYRVPADGGAVPEKLIAGGPNDEVMPAWQPDGKSLIFSRYNFIDQPYGLYLLDLATRKVTDMASVPQHQYYVPSWSPDGKYLLAVAQNPSRMMLYSAETNMWKELLRFDVPWSYWAWTPDSKAIYMGVIVNEDGIYRLSVPQGKWEKVIALRNIDTRELDDFISVTADGQPAIMSHTGVAQVYSLHWSR